ncbi:hypothetical protein AGMMS49942_29300 [Spirochaetia bacterium]|nr:hypothetical protein AGMMS49942_29300 [Spirochaetia bacterium]
MSRSNTCGFLRKIYQAAGEIHAEMGPGYKRKYYEIALAQRFSGGAYGCEQNVALPCVIPEAQWKSVFPRPEHINADFTFLNRHILVRVALYQWQIPDSVCRDMWRRMYAAGIPLGLILNFGSPVFEHRRVIYSRRMTQWLAERRSGGLVGSPAASSSQKGRITAFLYASDNRPLAGGSLYPPV